jgi:hypothetical protein
MGLGDRLLDSDGKRKLTANGTAMLLKGAPDDCYCCGNEPPEPDGAICYPDGTCVEGTEQEALDTGGTYQGDATTCAGTDCDGAICPDGGGACYQGTLAEATAAGDHYYGYGVDCADVNCDCDDCGHYVGKELLVDITVTSRQWPNSPVNINDCSGSPCGVSVETWNGTIQFVDGLSTCTFGGNVTYTLTEDPVCSGSTSASSSSVSFVVEIQGAGDSTVISFPRSCPDPEEPTLTINGPSLKNPAGTGNTRLFFFETLDPITCSCDQMAGSITVSCNQITLTRTAPCQPGYCEEFESPDPLGSGSVEIVGNLTVID